MKSGFAPADVRKIAVRDWQRRTSGSRAKDTRAQEAIQPVSPTLSQQPGQPLQPTVPDATLTPATGRNRAVIGTQTPR